MVKLTRRSAHTPGGFTSSAPAGFTLVELMVVILIGAILISIAIPSYNGQMRRSRRTEAKTALLDLASREERFFSTTNRYSNLPADLGYQPAALPMTVGNGYYQVDILVPAPAPPAPATYSLVATPLGDQALDTDCALFTVDQTGKQVATTPTCWN